TFSHFSTRDLRESRLEWHLAEFPEMRGTFNALRPEHAHITMLGAVRFAVPEVKQGTRVRLELQLVDAQGLVASRNAQELYFFARAQSTPPAVRLFAPASLIEPLRELGYSVTKDIASADIA